ncbi:hypothetical protein DS2_03165 [Catenovulum agarivorans DS-2]|uniref:Uncharacterized protein n=1 Tax=Catenovulum agarivorans DS-2 TaxID=1328313 RepID=W7R2C8_9ALTE|nr:hypothetical protein [Catenovulum agarivorans]EWH11790.1 hypothetical protein DS2_03165 [Catenovulum agarivorans DS-2]
MYRVATTILAFLSPSLMADNHIQFSTEAGLQHDSQLTIAELDGTASNQSDHALMLKAKLKGQFDITEVSQVSAGLQWSRKDYQSTQSYDTELKQFNLAGKWLFDSVRLGARYDFADVELANTPLLDMQMLTLDIGSMFGKKTYLRLSSTIKNKDFSELSERNANALAFGLDAFYFINLNHHLALSLTQENETANNERFDYSQHKMRSSYTYKFSSFGETAQLQLHYQWLEKNYHHYPINNVQGEPVAVRSDNNQAAGIEWQQPFAGYLTFISNIEYRDNQSNLTSADYSETLAQVRVKLSF